MSSVSLPSKVSIRFAVVPCGTSLFGTRRTVDMNSRVVFGGARASMVDSYESSSDFARRTEQAWLISQQPMPVSCSSCHSNGHVECKWCGGTGFFILGDNMLCQVPSRNTTCVICAGKGSMCCSDCKGTGFRAKWLGEPPVSK
ncbi:chaperone protein DnaJ [Mangifera indica]|uniref:chaperone protein DnaJ n=1 Tax=Mangifera indica TaxID=29780 RepID=UPI001CFBC7C7|nr:chaperone protein DnaJ [Mangifera indica]